MHSPCTKMSGNNHHEIGSVTVIEITTVKENHSFTGMAKGRDLKALVLLNTSCIHPIQRENVH